MSEPTPMTTPDDARRYVRTVADLYGDAVNDLLRIVADRVNRGLDDTAQRDKLADVLALRRQAQRVAARLSDRLDSELAAVLASAYDHGVGQGEENLARVLGLRDADADRTARAGLRVTKQRTVEALARAIGGKLRDLPILRATQDAYQRATAASLASPASGLSRRAATQRVLDRLAMQGIGGFRDRSGRNWRLDTYAEMSTRSGLAQAALQGSVDRIRETTPFVRVSDSADECERCRPWEGLVLLTVPRSEVPEKWRDVKVDGTLREATSAGLFHPNCTHGIGAFIPGLTRDRTQRPARANPQGYADRQEQRRLERGLREWKRREAVAITPEAKAKAQAKVRRWQQALAEHVQVAGRHRRYDREAT